MSVSKRFYVEHGIKGGVLMEFEYEVEASDYTPSTPSKTVGPPEMCDPGEAASVEVAHDTVRRRMIEPMDAPWETVPYSVFLEGLVLRKDLRDDPQDKPFRKTALQKAQELVEDELLEACEEDAEARYEAAMDAKADADRDDRMESRDWDFGGEF